MVLAELLGIPHATLIMHVEKTDTGVRVKRELEDGWFQHVEMPLPALLTIQSGGNKLRYATLMGIKKAKTKETAHGCGECGGSEGGNAGEGLSAGEAEANGDADGKPGGNSGKAGGEA